MGPRTLIVGSGGECRPHVVSVVEDVLHSVRSVRPEIFEFVDPDEVASILQDLDLAPSVEKVVTPLSVNLEEGDPESPVAQIALLELLEQVGDRIAC